ncbi:MAG: translation initiation factor IF-2 [Pseudomonadota bacterium]
MAKARVYEVARELALSNKDLFEKLGELNISVKNHMSVLEENEIAKLKQSLFAKKGNEASLEEKRVKTTVIRRRKVVSQVETPAVNNAAAEDKESEVFSAAVDADAIDAGIEPGTVNQQPVLVEERGKAKEAEVKPCAPSVLAATSVRHTQKGENAKIISIPEVVIPQPKEEVKAVNVSIDQTTNEKRDPVKPSFDLESKAGKRLTKRKIVELEADKNFLKKKFSLRNKEIIEGASLYDAPDKPGKRHGKAQKAFEKPNITVPKAIKRRIKIDDIIVVSELAKRMGVKAGEVVKRLMGLGVMATITQTLDFDTAALVANDFQYEIERAVFGEGDIMGQQIPDNPLTLALRPPVVTIMGHVDHGKTSLLDAIRQTNVTEGEAGGITQHIGAYHVNVQDKIVTFLDTPGHEAFTAMRARGAHVTDIVVLVVAADDGVMPQTIEAINHAKAANVSIIVAINKIDKAGADPSRVKRELSEQGLNPEEWGGSTIFLDVSAKQRIGIQELLEMILLQAEVMELKANPDRLAQGRVIEAKLDIGKGPIATMLVQNGTLHQGDVILCGAYYGRIRAMRDCLGEAVSEAGPSIPVEVIGLSGVPMAGDEFAAVDDEKKAKLVSVNRLQKQRTDELAKTSKLTLESLFERMKQGELKGLNIIVRADVQGSIEALTESLTKIISPEVKINIVHYAVGTITESDIMLATASNAIIIGFNVRANPKVQELAGKENVDVRYYNIIYNVINDIKDAIVGMMSSTFKEHSHGSAEIRQTFVIPKSGTVAGSYVTHGKIVRNSKARLIRDGVVIYDGVIDSLRRFENDAKEVQSGYECGLHIANYNDVKVGDVVECYYLEEIKPEL